MRQLRSGQRRRRSRTIKRPRAVSTDSGKQGNRLAIDDIGVSEIDLWHIARLEASVVKIDMSLVTDLDHSPSSRGFVRALLAMADELDILLIGEGVETEQEHRALLELGVPYAQGYFYGRPHPLGSWRSWSVVAE